MQKSTNDLFLSLIVLSAIALLLLYNFTKPFFAAKEESSMLATKEKAQTAKLILSNTEWKQRLTPLQFEVMRQGQNEPAFSGKYVTFFENGVYLCSACSLPLFSSIDKSDSKTGWPTFTKPIDEKNVLLKKENALGNENAIVFCAHCDSHLGHIEQDYFSINSVALNFIPAQIPAVQTIGK